MVYDTDFIGIATKTGSLVVQGVQHDEVQILAVELVFRIHLLVRDVLSMRPMHDKRNRQNPDIRMNSPFYRT